MVKFCRWRTLCILSCKKIISIKSRIGWSDCYLFSGNPRIGVLLHFVILNETPCIWSHILLNIHWFEKKAHFCVEMLLVIAYKNVYLLSGFLISVCTVLYIFVYFLLYKTRQLIRSLYCKTRKHFPWYPDMYGPFISPFLFIFFFMRWHFFLSVQYVELFNSTSLYGPLVRIKRRVNFFFFSRTIISFIPGQ